MDFKPPISERETDELIRIANFPDEWNPLAVAQAKQELLIRKVSATYEINKVADFREVEQEKEQIAAKRRANERFEWDDFLFGFHHVLLVMLFDWDMKKDGYLTKHRQRKYTLTILAFVIWILLLLYY